MVQFINMTEEILNFKYAFMFPESDAISINIDIEEESMSIILPDNMEKHDWMKLEFHKCSICTLDPEEHSYCPLALATDKPITLFSNRVSYEKVTIEVQAKERTYSAETDLQTGLTSLLGLLMATSGCPYFKFLRPMARYHLPFSTVKETVFRAVSTHLIREYFQRKKSIDYTFKKLIKSYEYIEDVNSDFMERVRGAMREDSGINALVILDIFAKNLPDTVENELKEIEYLFRH